MSTDGSGLRDEVSAELNVEPDDTPPVDQPDPVPARPADGAAKAKWVAYVTALGLHPDEAEKRTKDELVELADRLGG